MKCRSTDPFIKHPGDAELTRLLTVTEHAAVKGAPSELVQGLSDTVAHEVLGQGVVYPLFVAVGRFIGESLSLLRRSGLEDALTEQSHTMTELQNAA